MLAIVYANDGTAWNDGIIRYETDVINNSEVAPEIELMLLVFSLKHRIGCFEIDVFKIKCVLLPLHRRNTEAVNVNGG